MKAQSMKTNSCRLLSTIALTTLGVLLPSRAHHFSEPRTHNARLNVA